MIEKLLKYQKKDEELKKIEEALSTSEEYKKAISAKSYLNKFEQIKEKVDQKAANLIEKFNELEKQYKLFSEELLEFSQDEEIVDETQAQFLLNKAEDLDRRIKTLETSMSECEIEMKKLQKDYTEGKDIAKNARAQFNEYGKKYNELKNSKNEEIIAIKKELKALEQGIDEDIMKKYSEKRKDSKVFPILYEAEGEGCGYCRMGFSMSDQDKLKAGEIIECSQCKLLNYKK